MAEIIGSPANLWSQSNTLLRKNLTFQKRRMCTNIVLILIPGFSCMLFSSLQAVAEFFIAREISKACKSELGELPLTLEKAAAAAECAITSPTEWPPLLQIPEPGTRAVRASFFPFTDLPDESCRKKECPVTILMTGNNQTIAQRLATRMLPAGSFPAKSSGNITDWSTTVMGSVADLLSTYNSDPAFIFPGALIYNLQQQCPDREDSMQKAKLQVSKNTSYERYVQCLPCLHLWWNSSSDINNELYKGYRKGNSENKIKEILTAYDFSNTNAKTFNMRIWYNSTGDNSLLWIARLVNMATNAYLRYLKGPRTKIKFDFVKERPKGQTVIKMDISSLFGTVFFTWVVLQLFQVVLTSLVYEKQEKLRMMMRMMANGLGDGP